MRCIRIAGAGLLRALLVASMTLALQVPASASPSAAAGDMVALRDAMQASPPQTFADFLAAAEGHPALAGVTRERLAAGLMDPGALAASERNLLIRLLGVHARTRYGNAALETLTELVAIPTFEVEGLPQYQNPEFQRFAVALEALADELGLEFRNVGGRVYEIALGEPRGELIGVHAHADVVPANEALWVLEDGRRLQPYTVTRIGDRLYGRGTEDDKNGIIVAMYAMAMLKEEGLPLRRHFRLLVDTREETGGDAMPWYFERNPVPDYNIALDGGYPVVIAEKGYGTVMASFPVRTAVGDGAEIVELTGGLATNQIPSTSTVWFQSATPAEFAADLNERGADFADDLGGNFSVSAREDAGRVRLDLVGVSAHSSEPETGVNPVARMFEFVAQLHDERLLASNHFTDAARYARDNWGLDFLGTRLGIGYADAFMGPLTAAQTFVAMGETRLRTAVNLRLPIGRQPQAVVDEVRRKIDAWATDNQVNVSFEIGADSPMYRNPEGAWVKALLDIAVENLGIARAFGSSAGGTSIHDLPGGVQFGLSMPGAKYTGHNANEFKTVDQFLIDLQIVTEMFGRLGTMPRMQ